MAEEKRRRGFISRLMGGNRSCCSGFRIEPVEDGEARKEETPKQGATEGYGASGCTCCGAAVSGLRIIEVGGDRVGLLGLDDILAQTKMLGIKDEVQIKEYLLARIKERNYVTPGFEDKYKEALWREYKKVSP